MNKTIQIQITNIFKKYLVRRPEGQCQVLFSWYEVDNLVDEIVKISLSQSNQEIVKDFKQYLKDNQKSHKGYDAKCYYDAEYVFEEFETMLKIKTNNGK
jgi:hypothetical protein